MDSKTENWSVVSCILSLGWLGAWVTSGAWALFRGDILLGIVYLALWVVQYISCRYLACTRCPHYGKRCYLLGGLCAKKLFRERPRGACMPDDALIGIWWMVVLIFPVPFLIAWADWVGLILYLMIAAGWFISHHFIACKCCHNVECPMNPTKKNITCGEP